MVHLTRCCCGCSLRTGCLAIGVVSLFLSLTAFGSLLPLIADTDQLHESLTPAQYKVLRSVRWLIFAFSIFFLIQLFHDITLITGTLHDKSKHLIQWLMSASLLSASMILCNIWVAVQFAVHDSMRITIYMIIIAFINAPLQIYALVIVYSHYRILHREHQSARQLAAILAEKASALTQSIHSDHDCHSIRDSEPDVILEEDEQSIQTNQNKEQNGGKNMPEPETVETTKEKNVTVAEVV